MLLENVKPLLIVWLPVTAVNLSEGLDLSGVKIGDSNLQDAVDFVIKRTKENDVLVGQIPIPFYFYERLSSEKDASDEAMGFLLDSVTENIDISYPESPTSDTTNEQKASVVTVRNTINVSFRVKLNSTIVSVLRFLLKRVLTNKETVKNIRFSFFWNEYVLSYCKMINYDEEPITGTDLTLLKMKLETFSHPGTVGSGTGTAQKFSTSPLDYTNRVP